ncbi:MAG: DNA primase [Patescibacteria group bacterium]|nr:DNA primase [Patescibacteria group bacterium]MDE1966112.1 DNA primase [Patescibacteria group bacterium]
MATDTVQKIKDRLSIIDVVTPYVKLTKAGRYHKGLSPFNKEKTPSFFVSPDRGSYYCFSSGQGGDMFTFIEKMEGVDFKGALAILAEKAGVELVYERGADRSKNDRLFEAVARAEQSFARGLTPESGAYAYARSRGLTDATIRAWNLGVAPDAWRALLEEETGLGFSVPELVAAGLVKEADGKPGTFYDRFRNRLMFPIRDTAGRAVAFTGRALDAGNEAKYLNSPETDLFKKSEVLFGMHAAKDAIRTRGFALLVEGQMDLLHAHQAGFANTVALSGTALSERHIALIMRYSENLMLALDADRAGITAAGKSAVLALRKGMRVKAVRLPKGQDPADVIGKDPEDFARRVRDAKPIVEFYLDTLVESEGDPHRLVLAAERLVLPLVRAMQSPMEREHFIGVIARRLGIAETGVRGALARLPEDAVPIGRAPEAAALPEADEDPAALMLAAAARAYPGTALEKHVKSEYARITGMPLDDAANIPERYLFEAEAVIGEAPEPASAADLVLRFERAYVRSLLKAAGKSIALSEAAGDANELAAATARWSELAKRVKETEAQPSPKPHH